MSHLPGHVRRLFAAGADPFGWLCRLDFRGFPREFDRLQLNGLIEYRPGVRPPSEYRSLIMAGLVARGNASVDDYGGEWRLTDAGRAALTTDD